MLAKKQIDFYNENGYLHLKNALTSFDITQIRNEIPLCLNKSGIKVIREDNSTSIRSIMSYHDKNNLLNDYTRRNNILQVVKQITNREVYVSQSKINLKKGITGEKWDYHRGFTFWNLLDGMPNKNMISVFICLTDQSKDNGAVFVLEKSHKNVDLELIKEESSIIRAGVKKDTSSNLSIQIKQEYLDTYQKKYKKKYLLAKAGDVLLMHSCLLHASENNYTDNSRDLMITVYNPIDNLPTITNRPTYLCEKFDKNSIIKCVNELG